MIALICAVRCLYYSREAATGWISGHRLSADGCKAIALAGHRGESLAELYESKFFWSLRVAGNVCRARSAF